MRRFYLSRTHDVSGVSGIGDVAEGVQLSDGRCVLRWTLPVSTVGIYESVENLMAVHGHDGDTELVWFDVVPSEMQLHPGAMHHIGKAFVYVPPMRMRIRNRFSLGFLVAVVILVTLGFLVGVVDLTIEGPDWYDLFGHPGAGLPAPGPDYFSRPPS